MQQVSTQSVIKEVSARGEEDMLYVRNGLLAGLEVDEEQYYSAHFRINALKGANLMSCGNCEASPEQFGLVRFKQVARVEYASCGNCGFGEQ